MSTNSALLSGPEVHPIKAAEEVESIHPYIQIIRLRQDHRHSLRMNRAHFPVGFCGQKPVQIIRRLAVRQFPHGRPSTPYPGKKGERFSVAAGEPHRP